MKLNKVLIHAYLTNGDILVDFAVLFLRSLRKFNGEKHNVLLEGRDLTDKQIYKIEDAYKNLKIINRKIDYRIFTDDLNVSIDDIMKMKKDCEIKRKNITFFSMIWKQFISVEDRYRNSLKAGLEYCKENGIEYMLHFDIDTCFYNSMKPIFKKVEQNDVTLQFRPESCGDKRRIVGGFLGFKVNDNAFKFLDKWIEYIDAIPLKDKPKGYGQLSLYHTYKDMVNKIIIGKIPIEWSASVKNYKEKEKDELIILNCKGNKEISLATFRGIIGEKW